MHRRSLIRTAAVTAAAAVIAASGCAHRESAEQPRTGAAVQEAPVNPAVPAGTRLISDYSGMKQHEVVAWLWTQRGFSLSSYGTITVSPAENTSGIDSGDAPKQITEALQKALGAVERDPASARGLDVRSAVVDITPEPGFFRGWFPEIDDYPRIEVEIVMTDTASGAVQCKICHYTKDEKSLKKALNKAVRDIEHIIGQLS